MQFYSRCAILLFAVCTASASPFELTKEYMEKYQNEMQTLMKAADEYAPREFSFDKLFKDKEVLKHPHEFDFVIVGAGTSGAVLASRLSEVPEHSILLIEAGYQETPVSKIPAMHPFVARVNQWGYTTTAQKHWCHHQEKHECLVPTSKMLGGTTGLNEMVYSRGNRRDFDTWADEENKAWCYDDVLPYFKKSEDAHLHAFDRKYHSSGGLQSVEDNDLAHNLTKRFLKAGKELEFPLVDYNGKEQLGFGSLQLMTMNGERRSTFGSFIEKLRRKNLYILRGTQAVEVLISPHTKEAQGVKYIDPAGNVKVVKATKEVILSAGPINTAQLLMVSGVGPKTHLEKVGIETLIDLPVGKHLKDHPTVDLFFEDPHHHHEEKPKREVHETEDSEVSAPMAMSKESSEEVDLDEDLLLYLKDSHGPFTQPQIKALAFVKTPSSKATPKHPDVQLSLRQPSFPKEHNVAISVTLNRPMSHGSVHLASKDLLAHPLIDLNFYSDIEEEDMRTMKEGIAAARVVADQIGLVEVPDPSCAKDKVEDPEECLVRHRTRAIGDLTGTTRMGKDDKDSVVNNELQVHGVHHLRVVDLAVVPVSITGDVRATGIMIAEKAGDLIKEAWK